MLEGYTKCECGYDRIAAVTGPPNMEPSMELPRSPMMGRGLNGNVLLGLIFIGCGLAVALTSYGLLVKPVAPPVLIGWGAVVLGVVRFLRGMSQSRSE